MKFIHHINIYVLQRYIHYVVQPPSLLLQILITSPCRKHRTNFSLPPPFPISFCSNELVPQQLQNMTDEGFWDTTMVHLWAVGPLHNRFLCLVLNPGAFSSLPSFIYGKIFQALVHFLAGPELATSQWWELLFQRSLCLSTRHITKELSLVLGFFIGESQKIH